MSNWIKASLIAGFILKLFLIAGSRMNCPAPSMIPTKDKVYEGLFVILPWGTGIIFYAIPFIFSPWIN